jgi:hypothetical protein
VTTDPMTRDGKGKSVPVPGMRFETPPGRALPIRNLSQPKEAKK